MLRIIKKRTSLIWVVCGLCEKSSREAATHQKQTQNAIRVLMCCVWYCRFFLVGDL